MPEVYARTNRREQDVHMRFARGEAPKQKAL